MRRAAIVLLVVLSACGGRGRPPQAAGSGAARVVRSGFSIHDEQIGMGAIVRVDGKQGRRGIELDVSFFADDERVAQLRYRLPFCPARTECPWGQTAFGDRLAKNWRSIDRVEIDAMSDDGPVKGSPQIVELDLDSGTEAVKVIPLGKEGTVFLVAFDGDVPRSGYSFFTARGERRTLRYSKKIFPRTSDEQVRAYLYPGPVPARVHGPAD